MFDQPHLLGEIGHLNVSAERLGLRSECGYTKDKVQFMKLVQLQLYHPEKCISISLIYQNTTYKTWPI